MARVAARKATPLFFLLAALACPRQETGAVASVGDSLRFEVSRVPVLGSQGEDTRELRVYRAERLLLVDSLHIDSGGHNRLELGMLDGGQFVLTGFPRSYVIDLQQLKIQRADTDTAPMPVRVLGAFDSDSAGRWLFAPAGP